MGNLLAGVIGALVGLAEWPPVPGFKGGKNISAGFAIRSCGPPSTSSAQREISTIIAAAPCRQGSRPSTRVPSRHALRMAGRLCTCSAMIAHLQCRKTGVRPDQVSPWWRGSARTWMPSTGMKPLVRWIWLHVLCTPFGVHPIIVWAAIVALV